MIKKENIDQYNEEGFTIVEDVFSDLELNPVLNEFEEIVDTFANEAFESGKIENKHKDKNVFKRLAALERDFVGSSVLIHHKGELKPELAKLWSNSKLLDIVENWIGKDISGHPVWNIRSKTPQTVRMTVPWHQDSAYLKDGAEKTMQPAAWIPFLDVNSKNGCMQVVSGGHDPSRVLEHKLERKAGVKDSWYLYIEDKNIPQEKIITCEMKKGSVLFLHQLVPHRSLENLSDNVRWSVDLRFQNPKDEAGFHTGLVDPIIMRKSNDTNYVADLDKWFSEYGVAEANKFRGASKKDKFDTSVDGSWLERWDTEDTN